MPKLSDDMGEKCGAFWYFANICLQIVWRIIFATSNGWKLIFDAKIINYFFRPLNARWRIIPILNLPGAADDVFWFVFWMLNCVFFWRVSVIWYRVFLLTIVAKVPYDKSTASFSGVLPSSALHCSWSLTAMGSVWVLLFVFDHVVLKLRSTRG